MRSLFLALLLCACGGPAVATDLQPLGTSPVAPVTRSWLFDGSTGRYVRLEPVDVSSPTVDVHLRFRNRAGNGQWNRTQFAVMVYRGPDAVGSVVVLDAPAQSQPNAWQDTTVTVDLSAFPGATSVVPVVLPLYAEGAHLVDIAGFDAR